MDSTNIILVSTKSVSCDGGTDGHHPKIYLEIDDSNKTECPYCGNVFCYEEK